MLIRNYTLYFLFAVLMWAGIVHASNADFEASVSDNELFDYAIFPQDENPLINEYHNWVIHITDANSKPVENAQIAVGGGMAAHGHGLPSTPEVTEYLGDGKYLVEGVLFNMAGAWSLVFEVRTSKGRDKVKADFDLSF